MLNVIWKVNNWGKEGKEPFPAFLHEENSSVFKTVGSGPLMGHIINLLFHEPEKFLKDTIENANMCCRLTIIVMPECVIMPLFCETYTPDHDIKHISYWPTDLRRLDRTREYVCFFGVNTYG